MINSEALIRTTNIIMRFLGVTPNHSNNTAVKAQLMLAIPDITKTLSQSEKLKLADLVANHYEVENALIRLDFCQSIIQDIVSVFYHQKPATKEQLDKFRDNNIR